MENNEAQKLRIETFGLGMDERPEACTHPLADCIYAQAEEIAQLKAQLQASQDRVAQLEKAHTKLLSEHAATKDELTHHKDLNTEQAAQINTLQNEAITDPLTGLFNRRGFGQHVEKLTKEIVRDNIGLKKRSKREKIKYTPRRMGLIVLDIDYFKSINDAYEHAGGDVVLKEFTRRLTQKVRPGDVVGRIGGEEIAVAFTTDNDDKAQAATERLRRVIEDQPFEIVTENGFLKIQVTASFGLTIVPETFDGSGVALNKWLKVADRAMYAAKGKNCTSDNLADFRNRVCFAQEDAEGTVIIHECPRTGKPRVAMPQQKLKDQQTATVEQSAKMAPKKPIRKSGKADSPRALET